MNQVHLRRMEPADRSEVAELICVSMNYGFLERGLPARFSGGPVSADVFFQVYEALDPGCGVVAVNTQSGRLMGSCFFHPRPTHVSVGIMNVHPNYFRQGVARALLSHIIDYADRERKPLRLVSSAMNLDSFSLYTRAGFVPCRTYQDVFVEVPEEGLGRQVTGAERVREATADDVAAIGQLEQELVGIRREKDFHYCIENRDGFWHASVYEGERGGLEGFMLSSAHPGCNMIGPGLARTQEQAAALVLAELDRHRGRRPVMLVPVDCGGLVRQVYAWGGRNCEMHLSQIRTSTGILPVRPTGHWRDASATWPAASATGPPGGVYMPTFLPETG